MNYGSDDEFMERCRKINFSVESANYEKNLETLKDKLTKTDEEIYVMNKFKKHLTLAAAVVALFSISIVAFGGTVWRYLETRIIQGKEHVPNFTAIESSDGQMAMSAIHRDVEGPVVAVIEGRRTVLKDLCSFDNLDEALSHLVIGRPLLPAYLPDGFTFDRATFDICPTRNPEEVMAGKNVKIYYKSSQSELSISFTYYPEEWGFLYWADDLKEIEINGHRGLIGHGGLSLHIDDTAYLIRAEDLAPGQLIKIAESLE